MELVSPYIIGKGLYGVTLAGYPDAPVGFVQVNIEDVVENGVTRKQLVEQWALSDAPLRYQWSDDAEYTAAFTAGKGVLGAFPDRLPWTQSNVEPKEASDIVLTWKSAAPPSDKFPAAAARAMEKEKGFHLTTVTAMILQSPPFEPDPKHSEQGKRHWDEIIFLPGATDPKTVYGAAYAEEQRNTQGVRSTVTSELALADKVSVNAVQISLKPDMPADPKDYATWYRAARDRLTCDQKPAAGACANLVFLQSTVRGVDATGSHSFE